MKLLWSVVAKDFNSCDWIQTKSMALNSAYLKKNYKKTLKNWQYTRNINCYLVLAMCEYFLILYKTIIEDQQFNNFWMPSLALRDSFKRPYIWALLGQFFILWLINDLTTINSLSYKADPQQRLYRWQHTFRFCKYFPLC